MGALWRQTAEPEIWREDRHLRRCQTDQPFTAHLQEGCGQVSITMSEACLRRLLDSRHLVVEEIRCEDRASRDCVRRLLLTLISRNSNQA